MTPSDQARAQVPAALSRYGAATFDELAAATGLATSDLWNVLRALRLSGEIDAERHDLVVRYVAEPPSAPDAPLGDRL